MPYIEGTTLNNKSTSSNKNGTLTNRGYQTAAQLYQNAKAGQSAGSKSYGAQAVAAARGDNTPTTKTTNAKTNTGTVSQAVVAGRANPSSNNGTKYTVSNGKTSYAVDNKGTGSTGTFTNPYGSYVDTGSDTGITANTDYYTQLMDALMQQNEEARQAALDAIMQNLNAVKGTYKNQIQSVINEYNNQVNENEVKKAQARRVVRENQANRGQLDTGMGKQEQLDLNLGYDAITSQLNSAREQAVQEIYNLIAQAEADANTNRANVNNTYNNAMLQYQLANM